MIAELTRRICVRDGSQKTSLPEWAATLIWLGFWCRSQLRPNKRLVTFLVLPTRNLAAAFAGFGCLLAGARSFAQSLSWPRFRAKSPGSIVYWRKLGDRISYTGTVVDFPIIDGTEFIHLRIVKPIAMAKMGGNVCFSAKYFPEYQFSEQPFPNESRTQSLNKASAAISAMAGVASQNWVMANGVEGLIVTGMRGFETDSSAIQVVVDDCDALSLYELLSIAKSGNHVHAKLLMTHARGNLEADTPIAILDGPEAFRVHEHLSIKCNLLVILERQEYQEGIHDTVLQLASIAETPEIFLGDDGIPEVLLSGFEIASYMVQF